MIVSSVDIGQHPRRTSMQQNDMCGHRTTQNMRVRNNNHLTDINICVPYGSAASDILIKQPVLLFYQPVTSTGLQTTV